MVSLTGFSVSLTRALVRTSFPLCLQNTGCPEGWHCLPLASPSLLGGHSGLPLSGGTWWVGRGHPRCLCSLSHSAHRGGAAREDPGIWALSKETGHGCRHTHTHTQSVGLLKGFIDHEREMAQGSQGIRWGHPGMIISSCRWRGTGQGCHHHLRTCKREPKL